jgi:hypothetical protein
MAYGALNVDSVVSSNGVTSGGLYGFKNRIINGAMVIDQRNAGASVTPADAQFTLDRWSYNSDQASKGTIQQNAGAVTPPAGFSNYLGFTSTSAYSIGASELFALRTVIEGNNFSDMAFGTASASSITMSFWVRSSLTGTFGGAIENSGGSRSYVFSYTINSANTWEYKTITIAGDTSGTWLTTNGIGLTVRFGLGVGSSNSTTAGSWSGTRKFGVTGATSVVGTNGATFYITGVQLEKGSTATSFDYRPYGTELALCQRYFCSSFGIGTAPADGAASTFSSTWAAYTTTNVQCPFVSFPVQMRASPTIVTYRDTTQSSASGKWSYYSAGWNALTTTNAATVGQFGFNIDGSKTSAFTSGGAYLASGHFTAAAEL